MFYKQSSWAISAKFIANNLNYTKVIELIRIWSELIRKFQSPNLGQTRCLIWVNLWLYIHRALNMSIVSSLSRSNILDKIVTKLLKSSCKCYQIKQNFNFINESYLVLAWTDSCFNATAGLLVVSALDSFRIYTVVYVVKSWPFSFDVVGLHNIRLILAVTVDAGKNSQEERFD